jgi:G3E family GTPase
MSQPVIDVYLISGFLGAGKTTFLNRLLNEVPQDVKFLVLMNEFGEEGIDGVLIEDPELELVEISRGSIFCSCVKGDYIKALHRIAFTVEPDVLVIEASGVANPADMDRDMNTPIFGGRYNLKNKFCLIDAANFLDHYKTFNAVEEQITASDLFILNKVDLTTPEQLAEVKQVLGQLNPEAEIIETTYAQVAVDKIFGGWKRDQAQEAPEAGPVLSESEVDQVVDRILDSAALSLTPPDSLMSITCRWYQGSLEQFKAVAANLPPDVVRGKGFIFEDGVTYFYSHVGKTHEIEIYQGNPPKEPGLNRVVFIRKQAKDEDLKALFEDQGLNLMTEVVVGPC